MEMGQTIAQCRKELGLTQETLAQKLDVTNQAVSKWESDQCCPDITLLPRIADLLGISLDALFGREPRQLPVQPEGLPWKNDNTLRAVVYRGHTLLAHMDAVKEMMFTYYGEALNVECAFNLTCGNVAGDVDAGGNVTCGGVAGDVDAGGNVTCGNVDGDVDAGGSVHFRGQ